MRSAFTHAEIEELLGAYALDAVEDVEREVIERHLESCPRCRVEVEAHVEAASLIAAGASQPPEELWARISSTLERPVRRRSHHRSVPRFGSPSGRRRFAFRAAAGVAAVAAAAAIAVLAVKVSEGDRNVDLAAAASVAAAQPDAESVLLRSEDGTLSVVAVLLPNGNGYLASDNLEPLPADRTYQLWAVVGDRVISAGILGRDPGVSAFHMDGDVAGLAITEEQAGGVVSSTQPAVASWLRTV